MGGLITITKKEFLDHISSRKFLILFGTLLTAVMVSAIQAANEYTTAIQQEGFKNELFGLNIALSGIVQNIMLVGALLTITMSFDLINGERQRGSLKVLLSYPVYRDTVINGKFLGGLATIVLVAGTTILAGLGVFIGLSGAPQSSDNLVRYILFFAITILFLTLFLGVGLLFSTILKDSTSSLLGALFFWVASATLIPQIAYTVASIVNPVSFKVYEGVVYLGEGTDFEQLNFILRLISPTLNYQSTIDTILSTFQVVYDSKTRGVLNISVNQAIIDVLPNIFFLLAATILVFSACYWQFTRQEVS